MANQAELDGWWDGLTEQERADALSAGDEGHLSEAMEKSLKKAGLITQGKRKDRTLPGDVVEYLKMRH